MTTRATVSGSPVLAAAASLEFRSGDTFASGADVLVNPVNCVGVMGAGLALQFKRRYPAMFAAYAALCQQNLLLPAQPTIWDGQLDQRVLNFPTKRHWRDASRLDDIDAGLRYLADHFSSWRITSIALPPLGCGLGGLPWAAVRQLMIEHLAPLGAPVFIYGAPPEA